MSDKGFLKIAKVETLVVATFDASENNLEKTAAYQEKHTQSVYLEGTKPIDIQSKLAMVADTYDISPNSNDYFFEAIRGNTANIANENGDAFHKNELLRFDHRIGKQVYRTYENKPHQINHRAEDPKNARGFIVDAHYNDSAPPLDICPNCGNKTASADNRDETGIHCNKCGTIVKDEFVELLVAVDKKKDPTFADGVMRGILRHGSMGCSCMRTRCNVCNNVAYTRSEFCAHIKNKGKKYYDSEPSFNPIAFVIESPKGHSAGKSKKFAVAFEWCEGVIFDEYSRVHDPADPQAEQYEILKISNQINKLSNKEDQLRNESDILMLQSRLSQLERSVEEKLSNLQKVAAKISDVNIDISEPEGGPEEVEIESEEPLEEAPATPGTPIGELTPESMGLTPAGPGKQMSAPAAGMAPLPGPTIPPPPKRGGSIEGKSLRRALSNLGGPSMLRFANSYKHIKAEITSAGNVRIFDKDGTMFVVKPSAIPNDSKMAEKNGTELAKGVLTMIAEYGIGGTIKRTNAIVGTRLAQILDYYMDDMLNVDRDQTQSILDESESDKKEKQTRDQKTETATGTGSESDKKEEPEVKEYKNIDVLTGRETDVEDEQHDKNPTKLNVTEDADSDKREKRKDWNMGQSAIDDIQTDHKDKVAGKSQQGMDAKKHAIRLEKMFQSRLNAKIAEVEREKDEFIKSFKDRFIRAMKIVAHRQALNLEFSPLKTAMGTALCSDRDLGSGYEFTPMDEQLAINLVEAAFHEPIVDNSDKPPWEAAIDNLFERSSSIMEMTDESLMQVEADLKNMQAVAVPPEKPARSINRSEDHNLRDAARAGNLQFKSNDSVRNETGDKRSSIRDAMGTTKVAGHVAAYRN